MTAPHPTENLAACAAHADWKSMYEAAIQCAGEAAKTSDHLRDLLDQLAPEWRSFDAPGRRFRPTAPKETDR